MAYSYFTFELFEKLFYKLMYKETAEKHLRKVELFSCREIKHGTTQPATGVGWWILPLINSGVVLLLSRKLDILSMKKKER